MPSVPPGSPRPEPDVQRVALVTGASRGIGAEIALRLAEAGYGLTIAARQQPGVAAMAERLEEETSAAVQGGVADMADDDAVANLARAHEERFGRVPPPAAGGRAGLRSTRPIADMTPKNWPLPLRVNLRSSFLLIQQCLPLLRRTAAANM